MSVKFLKVRIEQSKRDAFLAKAKADGVTMTELIQGWIDEYLGEENAYFNNHQKDYQAILERLEAVEKKLETASQESTVINQETEDKLEKQIQYVDQRIDTLETLVITPLKEEFQGLKNSWKALFNQMRTLELNLNKMKK